MFRPLRRELWRNGVVYEMVTSWQGICLENRGEILVALKRNDEYALAHQSGAGLMGFQAK